MNIRYGVLVNVDGELLAVDADILTGTVTLNVLVKGKMATITLPVKEAAKLQDELEQHDVRGMASVF